MRGGRCKGNWTMEVVAPEGGSDETERRQKVPLRILFLMRVSGVRGLRIRMWSSQGGSSGVVLARNQAVTGLLPSRESRPHEPKSLVH